MQILSPELGFLSHFGCQGALTAAAVVFWRGLLFRRGQVRERTTLLEVLVLRRSASQCRFVVAQGADLQCTFLVLALGGCQMEQVQARCGEDGGEKMEVLHRGG